MIRTHKFLFSTKEKSAEETRDNNNNKKHEIEKNAKLQTQIHQSLFSID